MATPSSNTPPAWVIGWLALLSVGLAYALLRSPSPAPGPAPGDLAVASTAGKVAAGPSTGPGAVPGPIPGSKPVTAKPRPRPMPLAPGPLGLQWRNALGAPRIDACWALPAAAELSATQELDLTVHDDGTVSVADATPEGRETEGVRAFLDCLTQKTREAAPTLPPGRGLITLLRMQRALPKPG